ncbi:MAG TPA: hypothetical protein VFU17_11780, partial [Candidatus Limnocylindrales bacterium]|nr:hypothetical protein [Candidatus Limnocylindrales bacterium]
MSPTERATSPRPEPPWKRAEAGRYRSSDERFTISSEGPSRWFITDEEELDELGLARTVGPYDTLDDAKAAAEDRRGEGPADSPLAGRIAKGEAPKGRGAPARPKAPPEPKPKPAPPPPKTWLDKLEEGDREAARRARRLISALESEGISDADALVRRDVLGGQPVVAARLLARDILEAVGKSSKPESVINAVTEV